MKFSVPTNWQDDLLPVFSSPEVYEVYGKLAEDYVGGGRPAYTLPYIRKTRAAEYVNKIHNSNCEFNYLLNSSCMGGREFTRKGKREFFKLLDWLVKIKTDSVTLTLPFLAETVKRCFPGLKIKVSTMAHVDSIEKARFWESLGAVSITLSYTKLNRDFELLKKIKESVKCELQLMANNHCLYNCPLEEAHELFVSHASQSSRLEGYYIFDYCHLACRYKKISDPSLLISAPWIRPEDVHFYEEIGIDSIKIVDRRMSSNELIRIIRAYIEGRYEGNLIDLFPYFNGQTLSSFSNLLLKMKHIRPFQGKMLMLPKLKSLLGKIDIYIDNKSLEGFISFFLTHNCRLVACAECGYCKKVAEKAVKIDSHYQEKLCKEYGEFLDNLFTSN